MLAGGAEDVSIDQQRVVNLMHYSRFSEWLNGIHVRGDE